MTKRSKLPDQSRICGTSPTNDISQSIEWYATGQSRTVHVDGVRVSVRLVARKSRKARIAITAPAGAIFEATDASVANPKTKRTAKPSTE